MNLLLMLDFIVNKILFWGLATLLVVQIYFLIFNRGVPNVRTAPAIRNAIVKLIDEHAKNHKGPSFIVIDPGSGNGLLSRTIAERLPHVHVIGLEISKQCVLWSRLMARLKRLPNVEYQNVDIFNFNYKEADAIVMFLLPFHLEKLAPKLRAETKQGTLITTNKFAFNEAWVPHQILSVKTLYLHQKELYVYLT